MTFNPFLSLIFVGTKFLIKKIILLEIFILAYSPTQICYQSGVIPFRYLGDRLRVLLITSRSGKRWVIPKGVIEPDMSAAESARKEAYEEAGIRGFIYSQAFGEYQYKKWSGVCWMTLFLMEVDEILDQWPESEFRKRQWSGAGKLRDRLDDRIPRSLLKDLGRYISSSRSKKLIF